VTWIFPRPTFKRGDFRTLTVNGKKVDKFTVIETKKAWLVCWILRRKANAPSAAGAFLLGAA